MFTRGHGELPAASFSPGIWHEHGLSFSRSQQMRLMLHAARVLPGNSAAAERSPASPATNAATGPKLPVKTFRLGRVKAAVWENEADQKKFFNVTVARTYLDEAKNDHDTDSYGRDDLPLVVKLADQAHTFIFERLAELKAE